MDLQASATRKARVTPGTNGQAQKQRGFAAVFSGSQTGNIPGTTGNKAEPAGRICSRCDPLFQVPGTAETRAVTGCSRCSRCSRCDPAKQHHRSGGFQRLKPPEPAPAWAVACFLVCKSGAQRCTAARAQYRCRPRRSWAAAVCGARVRNSRNLRTCTVRRPGSRAAPGLQANLQRARGARRVA